MMTFKDYFSVSTWSFEALSTIPSSVWAAPFSVKKINFFTNKWTVGYKIGTHSVFTDLDFVFCLIFQFQTSWCNFDNINTELRWGICTISIVRYGFSSSWTSRSYWSSRIDAWLSCSDGDGFSKKMNELKRAFCTRYVY